MEILNIYFVLSSLWRHKWILWFIWNGHVILYYFNVSTAKLKYETMAYVVVIKGGLVLHDYLYYWLFYQDVAVVQLETLWYLHMGWQCILVRVAPSTILPPLLCLLLSVFQQISFSVLIWIQNKRHIFTLFHTFLMATVNYSQKRLPLPSCFSCFLKCICIVPGVNIHGHKRKCVSNRHCDSSMFHWKWLSSLTQTRRNAGKDMRKMEHLHCW